MTNSSITWRDLAPGLTAEQVDSLTRQEHQFGNHADADLILFDLAHEHVEGNQVDAQFAHVPVPAGVEHVDHWTQTGTGWQREIQGRCWTVAGVAVWIGGYQFADGRVEAFLSVDSRTTELSAGDGRAVMAALADAVEEVSRLSGAGVHQPEVTGPVVPLADVVGALTALRAQIRAEGDSETEPSISMMRRSEATGVVRAIGAVELLGDAAARQATVTTG